ncbi:MAG TPA: alpha-galactosidase, partial [bacterium]|nr:alpha-galactosidase [bacterium]
YRAGYQSWSPAGSIQVLDPDYKPRFFLPSRAGVNPRTPYSRKPGEKVSDWMAQVVEPGRGVSALMGFITSSRMNGHVEFEIKYDRFRRLEAVCDGEGMTVAPGESVSSEWLLLSLSIDPLAQQARYFETWGRAMNARPSRPASGWCTWYFAFWKVTENTVNKNLAALADWKGTLDYIQIDDGYERWVGDWTAWNDKFPTPPAAAVQRVKEAGFKAGVWLAPFFVSRKSPLYRQHPDWIVMNGRGRPVTVFIHPAWKGHVIYALDVTHPGVQKWLAATIKTLVSEFGFEYLKLDFLYAAAMPGVRYDKKATGAMALRQGLEIIREAAGDDVYILGCGCPLGPAVGLVDSMRVSQDVDIRWKIPVMDAVQGVPTGPGAGNCLKNNLARALMHGRLWANDPDCVVLRQTRGGMKEHELQTELTLMYLSGGALFLSEDVTSLPPERLEWFKRMVPPSNQAAVPLDLMEKDFPEILFLGRGDSALVALFNWSEQETNLTLDLARLGLEGSWHVHDYWAEQYLGIAASSLPLGPVPPHGHKYLRLVRADGKTRLLATNLHMGMGEVGLESEVATEGLKLKIVLSGKRRGKVWAVMPGGRLSVKDLEIMNEWEGTFP